MKVLILTVLLFVFLMNIETRAQTAKEFAEIWDRQHITKSLPSNMRHKDLQKYLEELKKLGVKIEEVGRSYAMREIYQIEWGRGATKVFMWSQMHGDEPTATPALVDMFAFLQKNRDKIGWVKRLEETLTIRAVPMLNPDGAEVFQRRNLQSIDINRDALDLKTPEGRLLLKLRNEWQPEIGFNLHNQNALTTVGRTAKQATISLLAVSGNPENRTNEGHERNKRISSLIINALNQFIPGHIGRYDDGFNPRAFGDTFSALGTPVILIETGGHHGKDERFAVKLNFIAYLTALQSLADGSEKRADAKIYETLPQNSSGRIFNIVFRRANIVNFRETKEPFVADVGINAERRRAQFPTPTVVREVGDLTIYEGLDEYDASNFYLVPREGVLSVGVGGEFLFYKRARQIDWNAIENLDEFLKNNQPDAVFSLNRWIKGESVVPKKK
jgi:hypothetical protein